MESQEIEIPEWDPNYRMQDLDMDIMGSKAQTEAILTSVENRRHVRKPAHWDIEGVWSDKTKFSAITENVSVSGMLIWVPKMADIGDRALLNISTFVCAQKFEFQAIAEVKHSSIASNRFRCGVEIIKISPNAKAFIRDFISGRNPHQMKKMREKMASEQVEMDQIESSRKDYRSQPGLNS